MQKKELEQSNIETFQALRFEQDKHILEQFSPEEQQEIRYKRRILSSLAYYIGKDFEIPVVLGVPDQQCPSGWKWQRNEDGTQFIQINIYDLLEKSFDYLCFVICHEGGHRRISRTEFIPMEVWSQPGFSFMMNAIEDSRDNNFVAENYHAFRRQMKLAYEHDLDIEKKAKKKANEKLGYQPRFMQAGFEYIKQWYREVQDKEVLLSEDLPKEVREVVVNTLESAQDSWWRYPSKEEADKSEDTIKQYAQVSYEINLEEIWPEFKKLVEKDNEDQKMQEFMKDIQGDKAQGDGQSLPEQIKDELTQQQKKELEEAIEKAIEEMQKGTDDNKNNEAKESDSQGIVNSESEQGEADEETHSSSVPIDLESLSDELKQKIKDLIDKLPDDKKKDLEDKANKSLGEFNEDISGDLDGKLSDNPDRKASRKEENSDDENGRKSDDDTENGESKTPEFNEHEDEIEKQKRIEVARRKMEEVFEDEGDNHYMEILKEVAPLIEDLTGELRNIFVKRKLDKASPGHRFGRKWNVKKRIKERIEGIPLIRTESKEQPENRSEQKDYAITILNDLSGSMQGAKIVEDFKSKIVLSETLASLNIKFEILGFQDKVLEFKTFDEELTDDTRNKLNQLLLEVEDDNPGGNNNCGDNDDGVCLAEASQSLSQRMEKNKFLIVLSDGKPGMDSEKKTSGQLNRELRETIDYITQNTNQKLLGVGLLSDAVSNFYPNNIPNVATEELMETLGEIIRDMIESY